MSERLFMKNITIVTFVLMLVFSFFITACEQKPSNKKSEANMENNFYSFTMNDIDGEAVSLSQYQGKVILVVNVASKCGFTKQYSGLEQLYEKYKDEGFTILGFPANNFLRQEPGTDSEIKSFCTTKYNVTFPMFSKISVKGKNIHPLYEYLTSPEENGEFGKPIKWNFNKFLIGKDGETINRFPSKTVPMDAQIIEALEGALKE
jgi:glutathione peroxidase-family protein